MNTTGHDRKQPGSGGRATERGPERATLPRARETATFQPYFWEAYNEIVRPDRYDWYLVSRWLPDLGPDGFTLLKVLRNQCYFNPKDGSLRDTCQMTVDNLAEMAGMTRTSVYRLLDKNAALQHFVQRLPEVIHVEGRTRRLPPRWRVCMDTPIHPGDLEAYDLLRSTREVQRAEDEAQKRKSQIGIYEQRKSQIQERKSQNQERKSQSGILKGIDSLPSGRDIPTESIPPVAEATPPINSPQGEGSHGSAVLGKGTGPQPSPDDPLCALWQQALGTLAGTLNRPTFEAHVKPLRLVSLDEAAATADLLCPNAFTREWLDKRHRAAIEAALSEAVGQPVTVRLTTGRGDA